MGFSCLAVSRGLWGRGLLPCAAIASPGGPGSYRGVSLSGGVLRVVGEWPPSLRRKGFARRAGHPPLVHPPGLLRCLEEPGPPGDWFSRHVPLAGIFLRRRPPGEPFSCKGFPSIPAPRTSSPHPRTFNVTPVTNFVTPRPGHGPASPDRHPRASAQPPPHRPGRAPRTWCARRTLRTNNRLRVFVKGASCAPLATTRAGCVGAKNFSPLQRGRTLWATMYTEPQETSPLLVPTLQRGNGAPAAPASGVAGGRQRPCPSCHRGHGPLLPTSTAAVVGAGHARDKKGISMPWSGVLPRREPMRLGRDGWHRGGRCPAKRWCARRTLVQTTAYAWSWVRRAHHATTAKHLQSISLPAAYILGGVPPTLPGGPENHSLKSIETTNIMVT